MGHYDKLKVCGINLNVTTEMQNEVLQLIRNEEYII